MNAGASYAATRFSLRYHVIAAALLILRHSCLRFSPPLMPRHAGHYAYFAMLLIFCAGLSPLRYARHAARLIFSRDAAAAFLLTPCRCARAADDTLMPL